VEEVQGRIWKSIFTIDDATEPSTAQVHDWLCARSQ